MQLKRFHQFATHWVVLSSFATAQAATLSVQDYLSQVRAQSPGYLASQAAAEGSAQTAKEGDLPYIPRFSVEAKHLYDARAIAGFLAGTQTRADTLSVGLEKTFDFGLKSRLSYNLLSNTTDNVPPALATLGAFSYVQGQTQLDLEQPLLRNGFGKDTRAAADRDEAISLQTHFTERLNSKRLLAQAEASYYRLAIARESVRLQTEVLDRAQRILDWTTKRVRQNLSDRSDLLQAKAASQLRQIELETNRNELRDASLEFNVLRNSTAEQVPEQLGVIGTKELLALQAPARAEKPDDVLAAEQGERVAVANDETSLQKAKPDLTLFGTLAVNGLDNNFSPAFRQSWTTQNPMYSVGVRLSVPLYVGETSEIRAGRVRQQLAAEQKTRQARLESDQNWIDLTKKLTEAKSRLRLADELVQAQREKLDHEKYRFNLGRTTTYQVLTFEQDYAQALITRLKIEQEIIGYYSELKIYAEDRT